MADAATQTRYRVEGMDCAACAAKIDTAVRRLPGIEDVAISATIGNMTVRHNGQSDLAELERAVTSLGYAIAPAGGAIAPGRHEHDNDKPPLYGNDHGAATGQWWESPKARLTAAAGLALIVAYGIGKLLPAIGHWAFVAAMLVGLVPIAQRAFLAARAGTAFSIETLMTIAAVGAVIIGAGEEAATVVLLFLVGELLEGVAAGRSRASIQGLTTLVPKTALLERNGHTEEVPAESVAVGGSHPCATG
jgi:Zn2+/Cd2+-exporting ATPase